MLHSGPFGAALAAGCVTISRAVRRGRGCHRALLTAIASWVAESRDGLMTIPAQNLHVETGACAGEVSARTPHDCGRNWASSDT